MEFGRQFSGSLILWNIKKAIAAAGQCLSDWPGATAFGKQTKLNSNSYRTKRDIATLIGRCPARVHIETMPDKTGSHKEEKQNLNP